jgi:hypothetical protein
VNWRYEHLLGDGFGGGRDGTRSIQCVRFLPRSPGRPSLTFPARHRNGVHATGWGTSPRRGQAMVKTMEVAVVHDVAKPLPTHADR